MKTGTLLLIAGLLLVTAVPLSGTQATAQERSFAIIVNTNNPAASITRRRASRLLLKMVTKWKEDGFTEEVKPVDLGSKSAIREEFSKDVHGRSVSSIKNYWQRQIFSGKGVPPPELDSEDAVVNFVRTNRGAIGYVSKKADLEGVKVLPLDGDGDE